MCSLKLPKNLDNATLAYLSDSGPSTRAQDSPYQDFLGIQKLLNLTAETAPAVIDVASLDWRGTYVQFGSYGGSNGTAENHIYLIKGSAATGFVAIEGCYGPQAMQVTCKPDSERHGTS